MNIDDLKAVIVDQRREIGIIVKAQDIIQRDSAGAYAPLVGRGITTVITGVRRCGKSVLCHQLLEGKEYQYINFDDERISGLKAEDLNDVLKAFYELYGKPKFILLDEVQNVAGWELFVNRLNRLGIETMVTGSNSKLLGRELATHLTGRHVPVCLFPFSFREFLRYDGISFSDEDLYDTEKVSMAKKKLEEYVRIGGFPQAEKNRDISRSYLSSLYFSIISKDIVMRHKLRLTEQFRAVANFLVSSSGEMVSYNRIKNLFGLKSVHTAKKYVSFLEEAYLICQIDKFSFKSQEIIRSQKKTYPIDTGLANAISSKVLETKGRTMECVVALEIMRRKSEDMQIYYWKDAMQREVDFVVRNEKSILELIQVCYSLEDEKTKEREIQSLLKASDALRCNSLKIVTWELDCTEKIDGKEIRYIPLYKWLLQSGR